MVEPERARDRRIWLIPLGTVPIAILWRTHPVRAPDAHLGADLLATYLLVWALILLSSRRSLEETRKGFLVTSVVLAGSVALLEMLALLRLVDFRVLFPIPLHEPWDHPGNHLDPKLLHIHQPHDDFLWGGIRYRYDRHGLRNAVDVEKAEVVVIGDSFIEGIGVAEKDLVTTRLGEELGRTVANIAQAWYGPQQELELLRRYGLPLHPRVCVWAFFEGNDLWDVARYKAVLPEWPALSRSKSSFWPRSFTRNGTAALRRLTRPDETAPDPEPLSGVFRRRDGEEVRMVFWDGGHWLSKEDEAALGDLRGIVRSACRLCRDHEAGFLFVFIPSKYRVYRDIASFEAHAAPLYWVVNDLPQRLAEIVRDEAPGAGFLDLTPAFREEARQGVQLYFDYDNHWTPEGHAAAAAAIARSLPREVNGGA
ncbi:MAG TPA: hypothetical protein VLQ45_10535 [Thermoanaerobaculia bacterium]|nr:hypothetical protein [Thermoanaerobaculia bacterium]